MEKREISRCLLFKIEMWSIDVHMQKKKIQAQPSIRLFDLYPIILHWIEYYITNILQDLMSVKSRSSYQNYSYISQFHVSIWMKKIKCMFCLIRWLDTPVHFFLTDKDYFGHCVMLVIRFVVQTQANYLWLHNNLSN